MTRNDIIRMARECGLHLGGPPIEPGLERFFHLAFAAGAKAEQDRCCGIIFGMAGSDNVAQRTVDAIRGKV